MIYIHTYILYIPLNVPETHSHSTRLVSSSSYATNQCWKNGMVILRWLAGRNDEIKKIRHNAYKVLSEFTAQLSTQCLC